MIFSCRNFISGCISIPLYCYLFLSLYAPVQSGRRRMASDGAKLRSPSRRGTPLMAGLMPSDTLSTPDTSVDHASPNTTDMLAGRFAFRYDRGEWRLNLAGVRNSEGSQGRESFDDVSSGSRDDNAADNSMKLNKGGDGDGDNDVRGHACIVERARTGRARCRLCGREIPKGQLRRASPPPPFCDRELMPQHPSPLLTGLSGRQ